MIVSASSPLSLSRSHGKLKPDNEAAKGKPVDRTEVLARGTVSHQSNGVENDIEPT